MPGNKIIRPRLIPQSHEAHLYQFNVDVKDIMKPHGAQEEFTGESRIIFVALGCLRLFKNLSSTRGKGISV
jgi:hypothetical protein